MSPVPCRVGPFSDFRDEAGPRTAADRCDHVDGWRDLLHEHFVALDVADPTDTPFTSTVRSTLVGHVSLAEVTSAPQSCVRTTRLARADSEHFLQVGLLARGRAVVEQDGREATFGPGRFVVYETDRPFTWHFPDPWTLLVLTWPRQLVDLDADVSRSATARALGDGSLGAIVGRMLAETVLAPPELADGGAHLADELCALVETTLGDRPGGQDRLSAPGAAALRSRAAAYIADHIEDPELGVEEIAHAHFVSVRTLHRAFAGADLTVATLIRRLRLASARRRLVDPRDQYLTVTEIAHACGFTDLPAFSRGFKFEYHETPSTYRRRGGGLPF